MCCKPALSVVVILMLILATPALATNLPLEAGANGASLLYQVDTKKKAEQSAPNNARNNQMIISRPKRYRMLRRPWINKCSPYNCGPMLPSGGTP
jgi:hypothetical protein